MTEAPVRAIPSPAAMAPRPRPAFDRARWEAADMASTLRPYARLVALVLAHSAGPAGYLPPDGPQKARRVAERARLNLNQARISMHVLETAGFLQRPAAETWHPTDIARPITLTFPSPAAQAADPGPTHPEAER
ncbi:hypothetical protein ACH4C6_07510 [Streptomyces sp. NPDC017943]|uniref:hypothetical protein n=1 Tax=Streptomyces sp. NPDC017943 TaxID=3365019 RepID=UPI0037B18BA9